MEIFERVPNVGEEIDVNGFHFKILAASKSRIDKIQMEISPNLYQENMRIESEE